MIDHVTNVQFAIDVDTTIFIKDNIDGLLILFSLFYMNK
jgi:hypothetical protein